MAKQNLSREKSALLGTESIPSLLIKQAVPASIGILVMSLNILVDTIFVGNWIGAVAIAAINVVLPVSFFIAALGMAIGIGGASIISRALGANDHAKAKRTFGNQLSLTVMITVVMVILGLIFINELVPAFGGKGDIFEPAKIYYRIVLYGVPILALCMMGNNVIRAEGSPKHAMIAMLIPSVGNLVLDYILINQMDMGMEGAAWATTISYGLCFLYIAWFFLSGRSELMPSLKQLLPDWIILKEIGSLGFVTLGRQATTSVLYLILNNILFELGGEDSVSAFGIIGRLMMFAIFPVLGITQGFLPIAGYNYGAQQWKRVREVIFTSIKYACILGVVIFVLLYVFASEIADVFIDNQAVIDQTAVAIRIVFFAVPIIAIQLIGAAYYQAIGRALPALLLTTLRTGIILIPLLLVLSHFYGIDGVWISFPIADVSSTIVTAYFLWKAMQKLYDAPEKDMPNQEV
ncbi:putative efflux protein, MATE family [Nonlabens sp. Hel1_33_55]|uniref:MATE family efflux transporter n=1 Tax=Nonlabens sp. Hel1_33_55 TaxID=1336802 RepID=UPI000875E0FD|nr:MATE family efflux transporter [Nonlabens sp. Hel1_33_55]SCY28944.1 putative efflux protein, MATE family [Nonlabens sp. Hel1_33_55]